MGDAVAGETVVSREPMEAFWRKGMAVPWLEVLNAGKSRSVRDDDRRDMLRIARLDKEG